MKDAEAEAGAWGEVRALVMNVIGFHDLAEREDIIKNEVQRLSYEAQVYAGGVALARKLAQLMTEAERP